MTSIALFISNLVHAATSDQGTIKALYVDESGNMAIKLNNGFPQAIASGECTTYNGWAGVTADAPTLK